MSRAIRFARHARRQTDTAIGRAYRALSSDSRRTAAFSELLSAVRKGSNFLVRPEIEGGRHLQIDALRNLAGFADEYLRSPRTWPGARGSVLCIAASLAHHLLGRYRVPKFLARVWFGGNGAEENERRRWSVEHARGLRFRDLARPWRMTRRMEHLFLASADHLTVEQAYRRAELLALGAGPDLIRTVLATRLGEDLSHARFWRTVMAFFVREENHLDLAMVDPIVDCFQALRHEPVEVHTESGLAVIPPPRPDFSVKGRTLASVQRIVADWHRALGRSCFGHLRWKPSRHRPLVIEEAPRDTRTPPVRWELMELTTGDDLKREGSALQHCVASYSYDCARGHSAIWSLRRRTSRGNLRSVITVEVDLRKHSVVQARGLRNRPASGRSLSLLREWAIRERLRLSI